MPDLADRRNASHIKADIEALGDNVNDLPFAIAPTINNTIEAFGALYVLEGSIMGGPYIVQMLKKGGIAKGFSFFCGYGELSGQKWAAFTQVLNALPKNETEVQQAVSSARETFSRFGEVFGELKAV